MRIVEEITDIQAANPYVFTVLENIGDVPIYHENYKVRHPFAAYNISLASVSSRIIRVLDALEDVQNKREFDSPKSQNWEVPLLEATDHMLDSLMEHMEDCSGIIRSFYPDAKNPEFKKALKNYNKSVAPYRDYIGKIVNYMKHNQGRLRTISFSWQQGSSLGYFVEGPLNSGGIGPVAGIHKNEATAFSFYRNIPFHLCNIYAVSRRLAVALHGIDNRLKSHKAKKTSEQQSNLSIALQRASNLPNIYFEDEVNMGVPLIKFSNNSIKIDCPSQKTKTKAIPGGAKITVSYKGDGATRTYKVPYYTQKN